MAKLEVGGLKLQARPGDLVPFVRGVALAFAAAAERERVDYRVDLPAGPVWAVFDPDQLDKVFANLLSNSLKFTPEGGAVHLTMRPEPAGPGAPGGRVTVRVRDSGPGIPAGELGHVFERFYQVDEAQTRLQPGTGIGLSLAKELAELHGGTLAVESAEGFGSTFTVTLPLDARRAERGGQTPEGDGSPAGPGPGTLHGPASLTEANDGSPDLHAPPPAPPSAPRVPHPALDRTTLLVVDDNADIRRYIRRHFEATYRIVEAADGAEALGVARRVLPDLIVSDVMMPGLDGFALVEALRADPALDYVPVILLTARATSESKIEGLTKGADDYLMKPFEMNELAARVENLIASRRRLRARFGQRAWAPPADGAEAVVSADAAFLARVRAVAEARVADEAFGVEKLAAEVGLSRSQLHRRLRAAGGEAPSDLLRTTRLERAARLLHARAGTVSEVAYAVGFRSVSYFSTCFHERYGVPPSAFRAEEATLD